MCSHLGTYQVLKQRIREREGHLEDHRREQRSAVEEVVQFMTLQRDSAKDENKEGMDQPTSPVRLDQAIAMDELYKLQLSHHKLSGMALDVQETSRVRIHFGKRYLTSMISYKHVGSSRAAEACGGQAIEGRKV